MIIRVLLADHHRIFREGLRSLLEKESDFRVVAEVCDGRTAVRKALELSPNLVLLDLTMLESDRIQFIHQILAKSPSSINCVPIHMLRQLPCGGHACSGRFWISAERMPAR